MPIDLCTRRGIRSVLALMLVGALTTAPLAASAGNTVRPTKSKARAAKAPKFDRGSGETTSERERRLYRECQGRANAGACEGYAR